jgi:hypothetical protein
MNARWLDGRQILQFKKSCNTEISKRRPLANSLGSRPSGPGTVSLTPRRTPFQHLSVLQYSVTLAMQPRMACNPPHRVRGSPASMEASMGSQNLTLQAMPSALLALSRSLPGHHNVDSPMVHSQSLLPWYPCPSAPEICLVILN